MEQKSVWNGAVARVLWIVSIWTLWLPTANGNGQWHMLPDELWGFWFMDRPTTSYNYDTNTFTFDYKINMHLGVSVTDNLRADIFMSDCVTHVGPEVGIIFETVNSDGHHVFQFDYTILQKTEPHPFQVTGVQSAQANFCLRFGMWTSPNPNETPQMVNWIDTDLTIYFDMAGDLAVDILTAKTIDTGDLGGRHRTFEEEEHKAYGYLCNPITREAISYQAVTQGMVLSVCIYLDESAIGQKLVVDTIYNFYWYKNEFDTTIVQVGFENSVNIDGLTISQCGGFNVTECHFDSMISSRFFYSPGIVWGEGVVMMKFRPKAPDSSSSRHRKVRRRLKLLDLHNEPSISKTLDGSNTTSVYRKARRRMQNRDLQDDSSIWKRPNGFNVTLYLEPDNSTTWQVTAGGMTILSTMTSIVSCALIACTILFI